MSYEYSFGEGTELSPYVVSSPADLQGINEHLDKHFIQSNDTSLHGINFVPIDNFAGVYDGNNKKIYSLYIKDLRSYASKRGTGLFGYTNNSFTLKNVILKNAYIEAIETPGTNNTYMKYGVGSLVGHIDENSNAILINCRGENIEIYSPNMTCYPSIGGLGGLIGIILKKSNIEKCSIINANIFHNRGSMGGPSGLGGLIGITYGESIIKKCFSSGSINTEKIDSVGGLIGYAFANTGTHVIENSYSRCNIICSDSIGAYIGGFIGFLLDNKNSGKASKIENCFAFGGLIPTTGGTIKGVFGQRNIYHSSSYTLNCYWDKELTGAETSPKGTGLSGIEAIQAINYAGFDFINIWDIDPNINLGHPFLREVFPDELPEKQEKRKRKIFPGLYPPNYPF